MRPQTQHFTQPNLGILTSYFRRTLDKCLKACFRGCRKELSDIELMESAGITVRGIDSIEKQLLDLVSDTGSILVGI